MRKDDLQKFRIIYFSTLLVDDNRIPFTSELIDHNGYFHRYGNSFVQKGDAYIPITVCIVEDEKTGDLYEVPPGEVRFIDHHKE